ncbi:MAG: hypothetical protein M3418_00225 [Gemmatimonadota bacterium]|jgi:hypothetical protein|nr:hypothetical protein [Gemmatimonadota bacterium]
MTPFLFEILVELMLIVGAGAFVFIPMWISSRMGPKAGSGNRQDGRGEVVAAR